MKWKTLESSNLFSSGLFSMDVKKCELPDGRIMPKYYVMSFPEWVNIVPVTKTGEIILIKQFRVPSDQVHIEVPGGTSDPKFNETIQRAAERELEEETGYTSTNWIHVGEHFPNPALQTNKTHTYLALDCELNSKQDLDPFEDIEVFTASVDEVNEMLVSGKINHTIVMNSLYMALHKLKNL